MEEYTNLETLNLDAFRCKIEILGNDDVHELSSVQTGLTGSRLCFSLCGDTVELLPRTWSLEGISTAVIDTERKGPELCFGNRHKLVHNVIPYYSITLRTHQDCLSV